MVLTREQLAQLAGKQVTHIVYRYNNEPEQRIEFTDEMQLESLVARLPFTRMAFYRNDYKYFEILKPSRWINCDSCGQPIDLSDDAQVACRSKFEDVDNDCDYGFRIYTCAQCQWPNCAACSEPLSRYVRCNGDRTFTCEKCCN